MSAPKVKPAPAGMTGEWNHERFLRACRARGIHSAPELARFVGTARARRHPAHVSLDPRAARRYWAGETDPTLGAPGKPAAAFELAVDLGVSLDWLVSKDPTP